MLEIAPNSIPTQIATAPHIFNHQVQTEMRDSGKFRDLIQRFEKGSLMILSTNIASADDVQPLINYLIRAGIPRTDIHIRFAEMEPNQLLRSKLSGGLAQSGLSFGADVAEHDAGFGRYFVTTHSYASIKSGQRHLVIGQKGSGKSAILRELTGKIGDNLTITPEHYATDVLDALAKDSRGTELAAYITTRKYTLLIEIFRRLAQTTGGDLAAVGEIRKYLIGHRDFSGDLSLFERFVAYIRRITKIKGKYGPTEVEIGLDGSQELENLFKMDELLA
jgi:hypothetical protein